MVIKSNVWDKFLNLVITIICHFNILQSFHSCKNDTFQMKNCDIFLIFGNIDCVCTSHSTKKKEFGRKKSKKITQLILNLFHFKLNSKHITTIIHSFA